MAPPILLLDEDQQRSLRAAQQQRSDSIGRGSNYRLGSFGAGSNGSYPMSPPSAVPRTNFPTRAGAQQQPQPQQLLPRSNYGHTQEPRTNFTSATRPGAGAKEPAFSGTNSFDRPTEHSSGTFNSSSPKTVFTSHQFGGGYDPNDAYRDDHPAIMDRNSDDEPDQDIGQGYIGNSSNQRLSATFALLGVALGVALGVLLGYLEVSPVTAKWISLPGDLFVRALKALVIPYVFCSVAVAIGDIVFVGKVSVVGLQTFKVFAIMWVVTSVLGMSVALLYRPLFRLDSAYQPTPTNAVGFTCANNQLLQMQSGPAATLACTGNATASGVAGSTAFGVKDVNNVFAKNVKSALALMTVTDQVISLLHLIVPSNILSSLVNGDLLSTITFAMVLGAIAGRAYFTKTRRVNYLYLALLQLRNTFFLAMEWVIWLTPVAVVSVIAGSFATNQESLHDLGKVYAYVLAILTAAALQIFVTQPAIIFVLARCNPYRQMTFMLRAYLFAFATSSSLATAPVTLACVKKARMCSQSLANFVVSIGACSNLSAMGFYFPIAIIWMAESSGGGDALTVWRLFAIFLLSILNCAGTPPIPNAGIAIMATVYKTVFGVSDLPATFPLYVAMDFFVDRISSMCDVNDDMLALKVIAENTDETIVGDHLGERE
ncbi:hypothetical protein PybrP1_000127 [[Pythium] brassicae (nom. inval.)]|nr:hypothetical protein PybrP1_000127 [[Pythium] brassicae (nom. inval.)]